MIFSPGWREQATPTIREEDATPLQARFDVEYCGAMGTRSVVSRLFMAAVVAGGITACGDKSSSGAAADKGQGPAAGAKKKRPPPRGPARPLHEALNKRYGFEGHDLGVESLAFSRDGRYLASGSYDKTVKVWDLQTGKVKRTFSGHEAWVPTVAFHPTDALVASGSGDKTIRINRYNRQTEPIVIREHNGIHAVAFSPDGEHVVAGGFGGGLRLWHVRSSDWRRTYQGHESDVHAVAFSPDGALLASGSADQTIRLWNVGSGKTVRVLEGHQDWVLSFTFSPDGKILRSVGREGALRTWQVSTGKPLRTHTVTGDKVRAADFSPDGALIAVSAGRQVRLLHAESAKVLRRFPKQPKRVTAVVFSPDGQTLAWGCNDATIQVWWAPAGTVAP